MEIKSKDFVEIEYTGRLEDGSVFDTTDKDIAKKAGIDTEKGKFGPAVICLGENHIIKGLEEKIIGKEPGNFKIDLTPEQAFGKKNAKLLKLIPMKLFKKENLNPFPGLEVNIDNTYGIIRAVSGGRIIVDFNHPLAGRQVTYEVKVNKIIENTLEKAKAVFKNELNLPDIKLHLIEKKLIVEQEIPETVLGAIKQRLLELVPEITEIELKVDSKN